MYTVYTYIGIWCIGNNVCVSCLLTPSFTPLFGQKERHASVWSSHLKGSQRVLCDHNVCAVWVVLKPKRPAALSVRCWMEEKESTLRSKKKHSVWWWSEWIWIILASPITQTLPANSVGWRSQQWEPRPPNSFAPERLVWTQDCKALK